MSGLDGRPILVTGAASGIGQALCARLATAGARIAMIDRDGDRLAEASRALGTAALPLVADVSQEAAVQTAVAHAAEQLGGIAGVATSAGIFLPGDLRPLADVDLDTFLGTLAVNLTGTFLTLRYALPHLVHARGAVVTIASTAALRGHGFGSGYTASKGGVVALTRLLAYQYGAQGVRANCVCPGMTDTPMTGGAYHQPQWQERIRRAVPLGRIAAPEEIATVACHLLSDEAAYVTGQVIAVDGGTGVM